MIIRKLGFEKKRTVTVRQAHKPPPLAMLIAKALALRRK